VLGVVAFRLLSLPPLLAYLAVGILIGRTRSDWSRTNRRVTREFGVVFLMFSIGLEFSLRDYGRCAA